MLNCPENVEIDDFPVVYIILIDLSFKLLFFLALLKQQIKISRSAFAFFLFWSALYKLFRGGRIISGKN